jgi:hypothetical protein
MTFSLVRRVVAGASAAVLGTLGIAAGAPAAAAATSSDSSFSRAASPSPGSGPEKSKPAGHVTAHHNNGLHGKIVSGHPHGTPTKAALRAGLRDGQAAGAAGTPPPPMQADDLAYDKGPIMQTTTTYLIFWNPDGSTITNAAKGLETQFLTDVGGNYYNILSQYYDNDGGTTHNIRPVTHFGGAYTDTTAYPHDGSTSHPVTDGDVQQEVQRAFNAHPEWQAPGLNTLYHVVLGEGIEFCEDNDKSYCTYSTGTHGIGAYHSSFSVDGTDVVYANDGNDAGRSCFGESTSPNDYDADGDVSTMSHEMFEAITDPLGSAWRTPSSRPDYGGQEIGDLCAYQYGTTATDGTNLVMNGHKYQVQEEWSNQKSDSGPAKADYAGCDVASGAVEGADKYAACSANVLPANDDGSTDTVTLPFPVNFFSEQFTTATVNNNGNITFDGPQWTYTPYGLLSTAHEIIAPYFGDVDTRGAGSGLVTYGGEAASGGHPAYFCVNWLDVGYYGSHTDKENSFQLLLIDRSASTHVAGDFDIVFNYDKVQWETGDASGGSGGLGGSPAVVGYSNGQNAALELPGSDLTGAFEDDGYFALTQGSRNSSVPGRYVFPVRNSGAPTGGTIHGTVTTDLYATLVRSAPVQACDTDSGACTLTQTNGQGIYSLAGLPPGNYMVQVNPPAGSSLFPDYDATTLPANGNAQIDFDLVGGAKVPDSVSLTYHRVNADGTPVLEWTKTTDILFEGCPNGQATVVVAMKDGSGSVTAPLTIDHFGIGIYTGQIPDLYPHVGAATVTITNTCPGSADQTVHFSVYVDPAGVVVDQNGNPIGGATVTLLRSDSSDGPFVAVPDGSALMSPGNRTNPDVTTADGTFGWDVMAGYYEVQASNAGCTDPANPLSTTVTSDSFAVPPPMTTLRLVLNCPAGGDTTPPVVQVSPQTYEANATGGYTGPVGGVTISDPDDATSVLTLTSDKPALLPLGSTTINYTVSDPAGNHSEAAQVVTVVDTTPPTITCPPDYAGTFTPAPATGTATATDIEDAHPTITSNAPTAFEPGTTTVTWKATDSSSNAATCAQQVSMHAATSTLYTGTQIVNVGTPMSAEATLSSAATACMAHQPLSFTLDRNPTSGAAGPYNLAAGVTNASGTVSSSPIGTTGWQEGVYEVTVTYAGIAGTCDPSADMATVTVASPGDASSGGGWYTLSGSGRVNFGYTVRKQTNGTYSGQFTLVNNGKWRLKGTLNTYSKTGNSGATGGVGTLYWWNSSLNGGLGGWAQAATNVSFTASFADKGTGAKNQQPDTFGLHVNYTPQSPQPSTLPNSSPVALKGGDIRVA